VLRAGAPASRAGRHAQPGRRRGGLAAAPRGAEAPYGGAEPSRASRGSTHSGDRRRRSSNGRSRAGLSLRGGGGRVVVARRAAVAQRALARTENDSK
jgi:hypothetical protein